MGFAPTMSVTATHNPTNSDGCSGFWTQTLLDILSSKGIFGCSCMIQMAKSKERWPCENCIGSRNQSGASASEVAALTTTATAKRAKADAFATFAPTYVTHLTTQAQSAATTAVTGVATSNASGLAALTAVVATSTSVVESFYATAVADAANPPPVDTDADNDGIADSPPPTATQRITASINTAKAADTTDRTAIHGSFTDLTTRRTTGATNTFVVQNTSEPTSGNNVNSYQTPVPGSTGTPPTPPSNGSAPATAFSTPPGARVTSADLDTFIRHAHAQDVELGGDPSILTPDLLMIQFMSQQLAKLEAAMVKNPTPRLRRQYQEAQNSAIQAATTAANRVGIANQGLANLNGKKLAFVEVELPVGFFKSFVEEAGRMRIYYDPTEEGAYDLALQTARMARIGKGLEGIHGDVAVGISAARIIASALPGDEIVDGLDAASNGDVKGVAIAAISIVFVGLNAVGEVTEGVSKVDNAIVDGITKQADEAVGVAADVGKLDVGCFIAGTPVLLAAVPALLVAAGHYEGDDQHLWSSPAAHTLTIEDVPLGSRVATQNPDRSDIDDSLPDPDSTWKLVHMEFRHKNGSLVDLEMLRPVEWIESHNLRPGARVSLSHSEIETRGSGRVLSITDCPLIADGEGAVVIARIMTHRAGDLVELRFENGETLTGTGNHPVWSVDRATWVELGALQPGEHVQGREGDLAIREVNPLPGFQPVYNLEVHGEHVYEVTHAGVLVHNNTLCEQLLELRAKLAKGGISDADNLLLKRLEESLERASPGGHVFDAKAHQWFGQASEGFKPTERQIEEWFNLLDHVGRSKNAFPDAVGGTETIAHLAKVDGKWFVVHYFKETGVLASAYMPHPDQLRGMFRKLGW